MSAIFVAEREVTKIINEIYELKQTNSRLMTENEKLVEENAKLVRQSLTKAKTGCSIIYCKKCKQWL